MTTLDALWFSAMLQRTNKGFMESRAQNLDESQKSRTSLAGSALSMMEHFLSVYTHSVHCRLSRGKMPNEVSFLSRKRWGHTEPSKKVLSQEKV